MQTVFIDGYSIMCRMYYGINSDTRYNALNGFLPFLSSNITYHKPDAGAVVLDSRAATIRSKFYPAYKATRHPLDEALHTQIDILKDLLPALGIRAVCESGFEGDDLIGTLTKAGEEQGYSNLIISGDKDMMQLVSDKTTLKYKHSGDTKNITADDIRTKYGIEPHQFRDIKALLGDRSDNIPGVTGIGEKTALKLIQQWGDVRTLYAHISDVTPDRVRNLLISGRADAALSYKLGCIIRKAPICKDMSFYTLTTPSLTDACEAADRTGIPELKPIIEQTCRQLKER